ncbi:MAG TPA: hypothetical protein PLR20_10885 [Syntrophales bacterium]|nr:hypothetical protein [Syntrophales bacterium]HPI57558.1 hypothetical protein [Syntrophales bacterium]HPN24715.1 hypothetical protein [Syntrophales bacterium]HQM29845.1 hypothetical protein [Syntrophales bacterium]
MNRGKSYYTYDANGNMTKAEYDSDIDGFMDQVSDYTFERRECTEDWEYPVFS